MSEVDTAADTRVVDGGQGQEPAEESTTAESRVDEANNARQGTAQDASRDDTDASASETIVESDDPVEREREARRKANREAQNLRERLRKFEEAEEARKREAMSKAEQLEADKSKAEKELEAAREEARKTTEELRSLKVRQEATSRALLSGAKQDRLEAVLRLTDLSGAVDEDGNPDAKVIDSAVKATLKAYPEFKIGVSNIGGPTNPPAEAPQGSKSIMNMTDEEIARLSQRAQWGERVSFP